MEEEVNNSCQGCGGCPDKDDHICPFADEIHNDDQTTCNCCANCTMVCHDEV
jgi:hypothetical protein